MSGERILPVIDSDATSFPATLTFALRDIVPTVDTIPFTGTLNDPLPSEATMNSVLGAMLRAASPEMLASITIFSHTAALLYFTRLAAAADSPLVSVPVRTGFSMVNCPSA